MELTWGDTVRVRANAPYGERAGAIAALVGIREVETEGHVQQFDGAPIGTKIYLVEFSDGSSMEMPEYWVEPVPDSRV